MFLFLQGLPLSLCPRPMAHEKLGMSKSQLCEGPASKCCSVSLVLTGLELSTGGSGGWVPGVQALHVPRALLFSQDLFLPALGTSEHNCFREELGVLPARIRSSALTRQKRHSHQESPAPGCALFRNCDCVYLKPRLSNCHLIFKRKRRKIFLGVSVWGSGARIPFHHPAGSVWRSPHCFPLDTPSYF
jgi:hypothetical protein